MGPFSQALGLAVAREAHQGVDARLAGHAVNALMLLDPTYAFKRATHASPLQN
jgi:hypothetical protein